MNISLPTVKILAPDVEGGVMIINESDFRPDTMELAPVAAVAVNLEDLGEEELKVWLTVRGVQYFEADEYDTLLDLAKKYKEV